MLVDTSVSFTLPTISGIPTACYTLIFDKVYSIKTSAEVTLASGSFNFDDPTQMILNHAVNSYDDRITLLDKGPDFYFLGEVNGANIVTTPTGMFSFTINFSDDCRTATIEP